VFFDVLPLTSKGKKVISYIPNHYHVMCSRREVNQSYPKTATLLLSILPQNVYSHYVSMPSARACAHGFRPHACDSVSCCSFTRRAILVQSHACHDASCLQEWNPKDHRTSVAVTAGNKAFIWWSTTGEYKGDWYVSRH
jgi:hypothetical protein